MAIERTLTPSIYVRIVCLDPIRTALGLNLSVDWEGCVSRNIVNAGFLLLDSLMAEHQALNLKMWDRYPTEHPVTTFSSVEEQRIFNPRVVGPIPTRLTSIYNRCQMFKSPSIHRTPTEV